MHSLRIHHTSSHCVCNFLFPFLFYPVSVCSLSLLCLCLFFTSNVLKHLRCFSCLLCLLVSLLFQSTCVCRASHRHLCLLDCCLHRSLFTPWLQTWRSHILLTFFAFSTPLVFCSTCSSCPLVTVHFPVSAADFRFCLPFLLPFFFLSALFLMNECRTHWRPHDGLFPG